MTRWLKRVCVAIVLTGVLACAGPVEACPMCKTANETELTPEAAARPRAYMMSILFMLAVPATLFTSFGITFYRLSKQQDAINEALLAQSDESDDVPH